MSKSCLRWIVPFAALSVLWGCGSDSVVDEGDAGDVGDDAHVAEGCESVSDCPSRQCEEAVACDLGECRYEDLHCGIPGRECPAQTCVSTMQVDGSYLNQCQNVANDGCPEGSVCEDNVCTAAAGGLRLRFQRFATGDTVETEDGLRLRGHVGDQAPHIGWQTTAGGLRLRGGLVTVRP